MDSMIDFFDSTCVPEIDFPVTSSERLNDIVGQAVEMFLPTFRLRSRGQKHEF